MALTPKLGLYLPTPTEVVDVRTAIHAQVQRIDGALDCVISLSTNRPVAPTRFTGMLIYEYDTNRVMFWNGAAWIYVAGNNGPGGRVAFTNDNTSLTVSTGSTSFPSYLNTTFEAVGGSTYLFHFNLATDSPAITELVALVYIKGGTGTVTTANTLVATMGVDTENFVNTPTNQSFTIPWRPGLSGVYTVGVFLQKPTGTPGATASFSGGVYNVLAIEDAG